MAFSPTKIGSPSELFGEFHALEIDALSFEAAAIALSELAAYVDNVDLPLRAVVRIARDDMREHFETETSPDGTKFFELDPEYAEKKERAVGFEHPILTRESDLKDAALDASAWSISAESIWFSTAGLPDYWAVHQFGSEDFGATFVKVGEESVLVRTGERQNIPPRPYIGLSEEAEAKILELFDIWFSNGLRGATKSFAVSSAGTLHERTPLGRFGARIFF